MEFQGTNPMNNNNNIDANNPNPNADNVGNAADAVLNANVGAPNIAAGQREQNHHIPAANLIRIMRSVLPSNAQISDAAREAMQECVSEYISFVTSEANERCQSEQRRTVTADDILWAMRRLGFSNYVEPLTLFMRKYREAEGNRQPYVRGGPLPATRFGSGTRPMPQQPVQPPMSSTLANPTAGTLMQQPVNPTTSTNVSPQPLPRPPLPPLPQQQQQEHGANEDTMSGYYIGAYEDEYGGSSSSFDPFLPYRQG